MSENTPETTGGTPEEPGTSEATPRPTETVEFWKAKAREQERRAKENADAARRLREVEDGAKSETQKALERAEAAEKAAGESASRALRFEVAAEKGLTAKQALRLLGTTREELEADADELLSILPTGTRVPNFDSGARPDNGGRALDMNSAIRRMAGR
jgi:hypothetical protein